MPDVLVIGGGVIGLAIAWRVCAARTAGHRSRPGARVRRVGTPPPACSPRSPSCTTASSRCCGSTSIRLAGIPAFAAELAAATGLRGRLPPVRARSGRLGRRRPRRPARPAQSYGTSLGVRPSCSPAASCASWSRPSRPGWPAACSPPATTRSTTARLHAALLEAVRRSGGDLQPERVVALRGSATGSPACARIGGDTDQRRVVVLAAGAWSAATGRPGGVGLPRCGRSRARRCGCAFRAGAAAAMSCAARSRATRSTSSRATTVNSSSARPARRPVRPAAARRCGLRAAARRAVAGARPERGRVRRGQHERPARARRTTRRSSVAVPSRGWSFATGHYRNGILLTPVTADASPT